MSAGLPFLLSLLLPACVLLLLAPSSLLLPVSGASCNGQQYSDGYGSTSDSDNLDKFFSVGVRESTPDSDTVAADVDKPFVGFGGSGETAIGNLTVNDELLAHGVVIVGQPCSSATPCTSQWHHMVVSVGPVGGTVAGKHTRSMWLDGVLIASDVSGGALEIRGGSSSHFRVGAGGNRANGPNSGFWQGDIDELLLFDTVLSPSDVLAHYQFADFSQVPPVAWYSFSEGAGAIAVDKITGGTHNINHGSSPIWGLPTDNPVCQPKCIPGFEDDGYLVTSAVALGNTGALAASFFNTNSFCVEAWLRRTGVGTGPDNIWFGAGTPSERGTAFKYWSIGVQGNDAGGSKGRIVMSTGSNDNIEFSAQEVPIDGQWYHVVACSERGSGGTTQARTAYKNGVQVGSSSNSGSSLALSAGTFAVGAGAGGSVQQGWLGHMDEFYLFSVLLTADQIKRHFYSDFTTTPTTNIAMWLSFDEETGSPQTVDSGGGLAMTLGATGYSFSGATSKLDAHCLTKKEPNWSCTVPGTSNDGWAALTKADSGFTSTLPYDFNTNSFTVELWARRTIAVPYGGTWDAETLFAVGSAYSASAQLWMGLRNSRPALGFWDDDCECGVTGTGITTTSITIDRSAWRHYAFVVGAFGAHGSAKHYRQIFVDGTSYLTQTSSGTKLALLNPQIFKVGWSSSTSTLKKWVGGIDELRLWTGRMLQADVTARAAGNFGSLTGLTLAAWYRFSEGESGAYGPRPTTAMDSSGNDNHLTAATGAVFKTSRHIGKCLPPQTAVASGCAAGTANDGYISVSDHRLTATQSSNIEWANIDFTVETWIRRTAPPTGALHTIFFTVAALGVSTSSTLVYCGFRDQTHVSSPNALSISFSGDNLLSTNPAAVILADNVWYHVSCQVARAGTQGAPSTSSHKRVVYKNAVVVGEDYSATRLQPSTQIFTIGKGMGASSHGPLQGDLDELYIYNEFLPRSTIYAHMLGDRTLPLRLLAYFPFNEQSGLVANDGSPNRNWVESDNVPKWNPPGTSSTGKCIQLCSPNAPTEGHASIASVAEITASAPADFSFNTSPFSVEMWVRPRFGTTSDSATSDRLFFTAGTFVGSTRQFLHCGVRHPTFGPSRQAFIGFWGDDMHTDLPWLFGDMRWKHVVLTIGAPSGSPLKHARCIYIDGKAAICEQSSGALNVASPRLFSIGGNVANGGHWMGDLDEAYLWRAVLTAAQVANHANGVFFADRPVSAGIIMAWYRLAETSGTTAADASGVTGPATINGGGLTWSAITAATTAQCRALEWTGFALSQPANSGPVSLGTPTYGIVTQTDQFGNSMYNYAQCAPAGQARVRVFRNGSIEAPYSPITVNFRNDLRWYSAAHQGSPPGASVIVTETVTGSVTLAMDATQPSGRLPVIHSGAGTSLSFQPPLMETFGFDANQPVPYSPPMTLGLRNYAVTSYSPATATIAGHVVNTVAGGFNLTLNSADIGKFVMKEYATAQAALGSTFSTLGVGLPCSLKGAAMAWLPLTGGSLVDQSGRNAVVTLLNASALTADRWGNANSAIDLTTPGLSAIAVMVAPPADNCAICAWFRTPAGSAQVNLWLVSTELPLTAYDRIVAIANGQATGYVYGSAPQFDMIETTNVTLNDGAWHHICQQLKENAQPHSLWVDGALAIAGVRSRSDFNWADRIHFGLNPMRAATSSVVLSDIAVFERSMLASEVFELYSQTAASELANTAHCFTIANRADGGFGWLLPPTPLFVLTGLTVQLGEGLPSAPSFPNGAITLSPPWSPSVFVYTFNCREFNTSMRVTPTWSDPVIQQGLYGKFGAAGVAMPMPSGSTHSYPLAPGSNVLYLTTINGVYEINIIRPRIIIQTLEIQTTQSALPNTVRLATGYLTPTFAAGVWPKYSAVLPFVQDQPTLAVTWSTPGGAFSVHYLEGGSESHDTPLTAGVFPTVLGPLMNELDSYSMIVYEDTTPVLQVDLTILPPALISVEWGSLQAGSIITPPVYTRSAPSTSNVIDVRGVLSTLTVTATFVGSCAVQVNGTWVGNATSGVPFDLAPSLPSANVNSVPISLVTLDGRYTWTVNSGCPTDFSCWPVSGGDPLCEFKCAWCRGLTIMRICLQQRPACCGDGSCAC